MGLVGGGVRKGEVEDDSGEEQHADDGVHGEECLVDGTGVCLCCELVFYEEGDGAES
ncbi:MAG: hypothetical protein RIS92_2366 [Verrucomicrobiota bacterium]